MQPRRVSLIIELAALTFWLGAAVLFAAVVAPALFAALPNRTLAGDVVGRVLPVLLYAGIVISVPFGFIEAFRQTAILNRWTGGISPPDVNDVVHYAEVPAAGRRAGFGFAVAAACVWALRIDYGIDQLRASVGQPIDALAPTDPRRVEFGRQHAYSVLALGVAMLAAFALAVSAARRLAQRDRPHPAPQPNFELSHHA